MIYVIGPKDKKDAPPGSFVVNTTSCSKNWSRGLSPFILGPVNLYGGYISRTVEAGWQRSKTYPCHVDEHGNPTQAYFDWAKQGWDNPRAERYPMGKGAIPLYSWWDGKKLSYVEARRQIYIPLYVQAVRHTDAFAQLKNLSSIYDDTYLWCFDGYNHRKLGMTYDQAIDCPDRKFGHSFCLAMLLDGVL
jgi:hypothetical protein